MHDCIWCLFSINIFCHCDTNVKFIIKYVRGWEHRICTWYDIFGSIVFVTWGTLAVNYHISGSQQVWWHELRLNFLSRYMATQVRGPAWTHNNFLCYRMAFKYDYISTSNMYAKIYYRRYMVIADMTALCLLVNLCCVKLVARKCFPHYRSLVWAIHRTLLHFPNKDQ